MTSATVTLHFIMPQIHFDYLITKVDVNTL